MENPIRHLRETLGDDLAEAVITVFQDDAPKLLLRLREQAAAGSASGVAREAHALAGSAGAVGLMSLAREARAIEHTARRDRATPDAATVSALEAHLNAAIATLRAEPVV